MVLLLPLPSSNDSCSAIALSPQCLLLRVTQAETRAQSKQEALSQWHGWLPEGRLPVVT